MYKPGGGSPHQASREMGPYGLTGLRATGLRAYGTTPYGLTGLRAGALRAYGLTGGHLTGLRTYGRALFLNGVFEFLRAYGLAPYRHMGHSYGLTGHPYGLTGLSDGLTGSRAYGPISRGKRCPEAGEKRVPAFGESILFSPLRPASDRPGQARHPFFSPLKATFHQIWA